MDWQKSIIQRDIIYYFKYQEFSGMFAINNSDNSIQINIKFFTVYEYKIEHEYILLSNLVSHSNNLFQLVLLDHCH